jgi:protein-S-isoprenylcysteine O-methyltransferase Ste14
VSKPEKQMTGPHFIYFGVALWVLALILLHFPGGIPSGRRIEGLAILGIPAGIVFIIIGVIMVIVKWIRKK